MTPRIGLACSSIGAEEPGSGGVYRHQVPDAYVRRVEEAGGLPLLLPVADPSRVGDYLRLVDGLLLVGGDDVAPALYGVAAHERLGHVDGARDRFEIALLRAARSGAVPTLGICRGVQVMNVAFGGTLVQDIPSLLPSALPHGGREDQTHTVEVVAGTRLAQALGPGVHSVNSHHHQAVDRIAPGLVVSARAPDGVVEGAEALDGGFFVGVQWHPERLPGAEATRRLFAAFLAAARGRPR